VRKLYFREEALLLTHNLVFKDKETFLDLQGIRTVEMGSHPRQREVDTQED
jgi:hypothetical protein